jgi:cadmium resistance protein CadD (predicted permease)
LQRLSLSFAGLWAVGLTIPKAWIRLLGIPPLGIGVRHLLQIRNQRSTQATEADGTLGVLSIAAITQANGADNVGVYVPFFLASRSHVWSVLTVYGLLVLVWCAIGKHLGIARFRDAMEATSQLAFLPIRSPFGVEFCRGGHFAA